MAKARNVVTVMLRLLSIAAGVVVEYREVFVVRDAQWILVFLGLWLMAIPPSLWLDSLRRGAAAIERTPMHPPSHTVPVEHDRRAP